MPSFFYNILHFTHNNYMFILRFLTRFIMNSLWKLAGGIFLAVIWLIFGFALCLTLIGVPLGLKCFRIAYFAWKPFGKEAVVAIDSNIVLNILWAATAGVVMLLISVVWLSVLMLTVIGIPLAYQWFKIIKVSLFPFGTVIL